MVGFGFPLVKLAGTYTAGGITFSPRSYPRVLRGVVVCLFFFEYSSGYFLLSVKRRPAAPNPARMPMNGIGAAGAGVVVATG